MFKVKYTYCSTVVTKNSLTVRVRVNFGKSDLLDVALLLIICDL